MGVIEKILDEFYETGVDTVFDLNGRTYKVFAYRSPGRERDCVRWNLYELDQDQEVATTGLSFGVAEGVREALEDVVKAAERHSQTGTIDPVSPHRASRRPNAQD